MDNTRANNAAARGTADRTNPSNTTTSTENTYVQGRIFKYFVISMASLTLPTLVEDLQLVCDL